MGAAIEINQLRKTYGHLVALDSISLTVAGGEFLTLLGPSGSGKTTLLMCLAGFTRPDQGSIKVGGAEISVLPPNRRNIGMVFQNYALFPHMTAGENVAYPLKLRGVSRSEREQRARAALDGVRLPGMEHRRIDQLSGGQRQRVAFARALVFDPAIILMDEPLSALDKKLRERMQVELRQLHARLSQTIVYVTHDQTEALTMSDRVAVMNGGAIEQIAAPQEIYERPATRFVADFIGDSFFIPLGRLSAGEREKLAPAAKGGERLLVVRPEKLDLAAPGQNLEDCIHFDGTIEDLMYQGDSLLVFVSLPGQERVHVKLAARSAAQRGIPAKGSPIRLALHHADAAIVDSGGSRP
ncbi:MAG TPA: ABC transporter ATP-binding protein [Dongiaceae bacterium]|nr:ABC transporter ATP-binding protein [Dongiaceae bacterium]